MSGLIDDILRAERPLFAQLVKSIVTGDKLSLSQLLATNPQLVRERSVADHRMTPLHYVAANGVETELQRQVPNADEIAATLLAEGAEPDAECSLYKGERTTLELLVSSDHPNEAGVTGKVVKVLCAAGAKVDGQKNDCSPLATALYFGIIDGVDALVGCGARSDNPVFAAAAGDVEKLRAWLKGDDGDLSGSTADFFPLSSDHKTVAEQALVFASMCGRTEVVRLLVENGVDANASPPGSHWTATPLHTAAIQGHNDVIALLLRFGADPNARDKMHGGRPIDWLPHARGPRRTFTKKIVKLLSTSS